METITYTGSLVTTSCWCGIAMAIPNDLYIYAKSKGETVYCPRGHAWVFGDTIKKQLARTQQELVESERRAQATRDLLDHETRSHAATKGHLTRQRKRVISGVCPVPGCKRHFKDLQRHMEARHPEYEEHVSA